MTTQIEQQRQRDSARGHWFDVDGVYELQTSETERARIERINRVLYDRRGMIFHVERLLGITAEMGS